VEAFIRLSASWANSMASVPASAENRAGPASAGPPMANCILSSDQFCSLGMSTSIVTAVSAKTYSSGARKQTTRQRTPAPASSC
jgi:hypothetical protein